MCIWKEIKKSDQIVQLKSKRLVVAKFGEDTSWTSEAKSFSTDVIIYDKGSERVTDPSGYDIINNSLVLLPNIGRESHTYLHHIVHNYEQLYDIEIFCQGRFSDHAPGIWDHIQKFESGLSGFSEFPNTKKIICLNEKSYIKASSLHPDVDFNNRGSGSFIFEASPGHIKIYEIAHGKPQEENDCAFREFSCHAIFAATREQIQRIPKEKYQKLLDLFTSPGETPTGYKSVAEYWAYEFEYCWRIIFTGPL